MFLVLVHFETWVTDDFKYSADKTIYKILIQETEFKTFRSANHSDSQ